MKRLWIVLLGLLLPCAAQAAGPCTGTITVLTNSGGGTPTTNWSTFQSTNNFACNMIIDSAANQLLPNVAALSDTMSNPTTTQIGSMLMTWNAGTSQWNRVPTNAVGTPDYVAPATAAIFEVSPTTAANTAGNPFFVSPGTSAIYQVSPTTGANTSGNPFFVAMVTGGGDPCAGTNKSTAEFESTSSGGQIVAGTASKQTYICAIRTHTSAAANISLVEGTGSSVCTGGSPTGVYLNPGTTAANGAAYAANGGDSFGNGGGTVAKTATAADNLCVVFTTTNAPQVNVHVSYVQQ